MTNKSRVYDRVYVWGGAGKRYGDKEYANTWVWVKYKV